MILCIIDGTKTIFSPAYFRQGEEGGQQAAEELTRGIHQHLADDKDVESQGFSLWTSLYINKRELADDMVSNAQCTAAQFERFCEGLSQTSSLTIIDVANKKGVDVKIKGIYIFPSDYKALFRSLYQNTSRLSRVFHRRFESFTVVRLILCSYLV